MSEPTLADTETESLCVLFHDAYEAAAVEAGWETQERSRKPWADVPEANKATMRATIRTVLASDWLAARVADAVERERAAWVAKWDEGYERAVTDRDVGTGFYDAKFRANPYRGLLAADDTETYDESWRP